MNKKIQSTFLLFLTAMIWGVAFVAQLLGTQHVGVYTFNSVRFLIGGLSLIPVIMLFEIKDRNNKQLKCTVFAAVIAGVVLFAASTLQQFGVMITGSAGKSGFITGLYTVLVPIFGVFLGKKTSANTWVGAIFAVVGLYLLSFANGISEIGFGDLVLLLGSVMWAIHILIIDAYSERIYSLIFAMLQFLTCGILSLCGLFLFEEISLSSIYAARYPILYAGFMSVGIAYTCQIIGQKHADPTVATVILSTESVFSALGEAVVFGLILTSSEYTPIGVKGYIGCVIMFVGIIIAQLDFKKILKKH